jgi:hypothetical protein
MPDKRNAVPRSCLVGLSGSRRQCGDPRGVSGRTAAAGAALTRQNLRIMSDFDYRCLDCKHEWDEEDGATWPARCPSCGSGSIEDPDDEGPPEIAADTTSSNPWDGVERRAKGVFKS